MFRGPIWSSIVQVCALLLTALYLISGLAYLSLDYWTVTQQDFWRIYHICLNNSWMHSAFYKFNGHSLFFPSFIWLADLRFFHGDQAIIFYASLALLIASTVLLLIPIWRDQALDLTTKLLGTLLIVGTSFWCGRASITAASGFNCMASFVMLGMAWALLLLPTIQRPAERWWLTSCLLVFAGYIASFSFATGLAIWPCLIFLGWCLRFNPRSFAVLILGTVTAALIFHFLPPRSAPSALFPPDTPIRTVILEGFDDFFRLMGAPVLYCAAAWQNVRVTTELTKSSTLLVWAGGIGVLAAIVVMITYCVRRKLEGRSLEIVGLAFITFNLASLFLVVAGRLVYFREFPGQLAAPRYLFWSSLFWTGQCLVVLGWATRKQWLRLPATLLVFAMPVLGWAYHIEEGVHWRYSRLITEQSAVGLINGVFDPDQTLFRELSNVKMLTPELRVRRLDMFADGLQNWIGKESHEVFKGHHVANHFRGVAYIEPLPLEQQQNTAVRVNGHLQQGRRPAARAMVILDPNGVIVGVARSFVTNGFFDSLLFRDRMAHAPFRGYIAHYDPSMNYVLRSADKGRLSDKEIKIAPSKTN